MELLLISKQFTRKMKMLAVGVALLLSAAAPLTYFVLEYQDGNERAAFYAQKYALKFQRAIQENPKYWQLNLEKFVEIFADTKAGDKIEAIEVYDSELRLLHREMLLETSLLSIHQTAEIRYNNRLYGFVVIHENLAHVIRNTVFLLFLFSIAGLVIARSIRRVNTLVGELVEANNHLELLAITDEKTGLFNATASFVKLQRAIETACQYGSGLCVLLIDVDHFKKYNDLYGHLKGDEALVQLAKLLKSSVYPTDITGRFGGEEFIVILPCTGEVEGLERAERIRSAVNHFSFAGEEYLPKGKLTVSIGVAYHMDGNITPQELLKQADEALYWAKETGRNNARLYSKQKPSAEVPSQLNMADIIPSMKQEMTNKVLSKFIEDANSNMYEVYEPTARGLLKALEMWEVHTVQHSLRVNRIALEIGKGLELSAKELSNLNLGTLLHDIGKLSIGDSILLKEQPLTPEEYRLIQKHPQAGFDIVKDNEFLSDAAKVILYHHERFDGKGYPYGLAGMDVPLLARVCSVADSFEAMTADRPYKKSISLEEAIKEIVRNSGSQFDPQVVASFLKIYDDKSTVPLE